MYLSSDVNWSYFLLSVYRFLSLPIFLSSQFLPVFLSPSSLFCSFTNMCLHMLLDDIVCASQSGMDCIAFYNIVSGVDLVVHNDAN